MRWVKWLLWLVTTGLVVSLGELAWWGRAYFINLPFWLKLPPVAQGPGPEQYERWAMIRHNFSIWTVVTAVLLAVYAVYVCAVVTRKQWRSADLKG
jgi:hypothetical protein